MRSALVYIVVALAPLAFAAQLWPGLKGTSQKLLKLLCALIVSKLVIAVALAVAAAAAVGTGSGGEVTALPEPEVMAEDPGGSVTQAVGLLLTASVAFVVAAFSPLLVARLFPLAEDASVAQGIRGMPARAFQQTLSTAYSVQMLRMYRHRGLASGHGGSEGGGDQGGGGGGPGVGGGPGSRPSGGPSQRGGGQRKATAGRATGTAGGSAAKGTGASGTGGAAAAGAAAGPVGVAAAAAQQAGSKVAGATKRGTQAVKHRADAQVDSAGGGSPAGAGNSARSGRRGAASDSTQPSSDQSDQPERRARSPRRPPTGGSGG